MTTKYREAQGSFSSSIAANDFVNEVLRSAREAVNLVAEGHSDRIMLEKRFGYITGTEAYRPNGNSDPYIRDAYAVRVILRHDERSERGFTVYTAFPVNELIMEKIR